MYALLATLLIAGPVDVARAQVAKGAFQPALDTLKTALPLDDHEAAEAAALRASALLALGEKHRQEAADALAAMWHLDQSGGALFSSTDAAKALAQEIRSQRALVLHEREAQVPSGRPLRLRARLAGARVGEPQVVLSYRTETMDEFVRVPMEPVATGDEVEAWLRPGVGGVPVSGDHVVHYYIEAVGPGSAVLDSNGTAAQPLRVELSTRSAVPAVAIASTLDEGGRPLHPTLPPPPTPWYKKWQIMAPAGGLLVAGGVAAVFLLQPKPQPQAGSLGRVDLP